MKLHETDMQMAERHQELMALLTMVSYAFDIAQSLGSSAAASCMQAARDALVDDLTREFGGMLSAEGIGRLAASRAGRC